MYVKPIALSRDGKGLMVDTGKVAYHVHSDEMTPTERQLHQLLVEKENDNG